MRSIILLAVMLSMQVLVMGGIHHKTSSIKFETDSHHLDKQNKKKLIDFLGEIDLERDFTLQINGHTDSRGSLGYNDALSQRRVNTIRQFLLEQGIEPSLITSGYYGEMRPVDDNASESGRAINRRVDVVYTYNYFNDVSELNDSLAAGTVQHFTIDPTKDNLLAGSKGISILLDANSLIDAKGNPVKSKVEVTLTECLDYAAYFGHGLATESGERLLESGGMLKLEAKLPGGDVLRLDTTHPALVSIPTESIKEGMKLFLSDSGNNWTETAQMIDERPYPVRTCWKSSWNLLSYDDYRVDSSYMPRKPARPVRPRWPHAPRESSYQPVTHWYHFLSKNKVEEAYRDRYERAVKTFENKKQLYFERLEKYKQDSVAYLTKLIRYSEELREWQLAEEKNEQLFIETMEELNKERLKFYKRQESARYTRCDSLRDLEIAAISERMKILENDGNVTAADLKHYVFSVQSLNWINCDRFPKYPQEGIRRIAIWDNDDLPENVKVVLPEINGMVRMKKYEGAYVPCVRFPKNHKGLVFAYKVMDGRPYIFLHKLSELENVEMHFSPVRFSQLKDILTNITNPESLDKIVSSFYSLAQR